MCLFVDLFRSSRQAVFLPFPVVNRLRLNETRRTDKAAMSLGAHIWCPTTVSRATPGSPTWRGT